jgi:hypothetical protein
MNGWMKWLAAAACVAVIGGVGYSIVTDRGDRRAAERDASRDAKLTACRNRISDMRSGRRSGDDQTVLTDCALNGYIRQQEMIEALKP